jgi:DNA polymerase elongation subunit (family B)
MESFNAFVYSWHVDDDGIIHGFALDPENRTVHLEINGFTPYTYMELPTQFEWTELRRQAILSSISEFPQEIQPVVKSFMNKKKLYDANVVLNSKYNPLEKETKEGKYLYKTFPYLFLAFNTKTAMTAFIKKMGYGTYIPSLGRKHRFKFHEVLASPILQFTCIRKIPTTGWISGKGKLILNQDEKSSSCAFEYEVKWSDVNPCTNQAILKTVPCPIVLMFDGEANSDNIATMPKNRPNDKMFQISFAVNRHGSKNVTKHILSLGELDQKMVGEEVAIHTYSTEGDLLIGFCELIQEIDPQIIGGYNILGWDFMYLIQRAKLNGVFSEFSKLGYLKGVQSKEKKISWSSSAFNSQNFILLDVPGRLIIDMLPLVRRDFKFSRYDLGSVATEILGQTKDPLTHKGIFKCYRIFSKASLSLVAKYCVQDSNVTLLLFDKLNTWIGMCQMSAIFGVGILDLYTQGQQLKIYSQVYRECLDKNIVVEQDAFTCGEDESYTGAIVLDPEPGMYKDVVTFDFASLYPSVMMANNICYSTRVTDPNIPDEDCHIFDWWDHQGCEHDRIVRATKIKKVVCVHRRYRFLKAPMGVIPAILHELISKRKATKKEGESEELRAKTTENEEIKKAILMYAMVCDMKQLALKVSANSIYGGMGVRKGKLPFMVGAMCVTAGGREAILKAKRLIMEKYPGKDVYGDTDSLMYIFDCMERFRNTEGKTDYKALEKYACEVSEDVSKSFPPPMKLEYENTAEDFFILTKKRYMTLLTNKKYKKRGIMITRRDNALGCRNLYEGMLKNIFAYKALKEVEIFLVDALNDIYSHKLPTKDYSITKSIKEIDQYKIKSPDKDPAKRKKQFMNKLLDSEKHTDADYLLRSLPAHVQLAERMRRRGMFIEAGSRIEYVVTTSGGIKGKIWQKIESSEYYKDHSDMIRLDMNYYCKSLVNPGDQAMETMYKRKNFFKEQLDIRILKQECLDELKLIFSSGIILEE